MNIHAYGHLWCLGGYEWDGWMRYGLWIGSLVLLADLSIHRLPKAYLLRRSLLFGQLRLTDFNLPAEACWVDGWRLAHKRSRPLDIYWCIFLDLSRELSHKKSVRFGTLYTKRTLIPVAKA